MLLWLVIWCAWVVYACICLRGSICLPGSCIYVILILIHVFTLQLLQECVFVCLCISHVLMSVSIRYLGLRRACLLVYCLVVTLRLIFGEPSVFAKRNCIHVLESQFKLHDHRQQNVIHLTAFNYWQNSHFRSSTQLYSKTDHPMFTVFPTACNVPTCLKDGD
jgi:hypothetical protein